jgi:hypothetical protein
MTEQALSVDAQDDPEGAISRAGEEFAAAWVRAADASDLAELVARDPRIPQGLDVQLLVAAEEAVGFSLRGNQDRRHALRAGFWSVLRSS